MTFKVLKSAGFRIDDIYVWTAQNFGIEQANSYIRELFDSFEKIERGESFSKPIPADFGIQGYYYRFKRHFVYWKYLESGEIGIVTVLHEKMMQISRFQEDVI